MLRISNNDDRAGVILAFRLSVRRIIVHLVILLTIAGFQAEVSYAQHYARLSDRQRIEMAVDMVRKGVQSEDTTMVFMVFAPQVVDKGKDLENKEDLTARLQAVFDQSSAREQMLERPSFSRVDNPLNLSNFWDFDILDPQITIRGDSAFVDCELVLWGAAPEAISRSRGRRISETFVLVSPPKVAPTIIPEGSQRFPATTGNSPVDRIRGWQLAGYRSLLGFLEGAVGSDNNMQDKTIGEQR